MRMPWNKPKPTQLELLDAESTNAERAGASLDTVSPTLPTRPTQPTHASHSTSVADANTGKPLLVLLSRLIEDPNNPRTEFLGAALDELAADIRLRGVLEPLVVHPADSEGRHRIHFGAMRFRAAIRAGLQEVPVVVRDAPADRYAQAAENGKRYGLSPLELAGLIRAQVIAGDSNATVAKQLGMNLTAVAHHLTLLDLPPELDQALKSGRCTSPRTLHELSKLHEVQPKQIQRLLASGSEITRSAVSALRAAPDEGVATGSAPSSWNKLITRANSACDRLERALGHITTSNSDMVVLPELIALRIRVEDITKHWLQGSDRQTPSQADH